MSTTSTFNTVRVLTRSEFKNNFSSTSNDTLYFVESPINIYIINNYMSGTSGYRIWNNGYCEQWGRLAKGGTIAKTSSWNGTVSLAKTYANTNYHVIVGINTGTTAANNKGDEVGTGGMTTSSFGFSAYNRSSSATVSSIELVWLTRGYLASGQY